MLFTIDLTQEIGDPLFRAPCIVDGVVEAEITTRCIASEQCLDAPNCTTDVDHVYRAIVHRCRDIELTHIADGKTSVATVQLTTSPQASLFRQLNAIHSQLSLRQSASVRNTE